MAVTLLKNLGTEPLSLGSPYNMILRGGSSIIVSGTPEQCLANLPGVSPSVLSCTLVLDQPTTGTPALYIPGQSNAESYGSASGLSVGNAQYAQTYTLINFMRLSNVAGDPLTDGLYYDGDTIHASSGTANPPSTFQFSIGPHFTPSINPDNVGPECSISRQLVARNSDIKTILSFTMAGSILHTQWNNPAYPSNPPSLQNREYAFLDAAGVKLAGTYWNQGEGDAKLSSDATVYAAQMKIRWDAFFARYGRHPLIMTQLPTWLTLTPYAQRDTVRAQQALFAATYPWVTLIDTSSLTDRGDLTHLDANSQVALGILVEAALAAARQTTTLSAVFGAPATVSAGAIAFSYTVDVTVGSANDAGTISVVVTLPAGVSLTGSSGSGWSVSNSSGVVTCTRSSGTKGTALPQLVLSCTSPGGVGSGSMTATATVVGSNVTDLASLSGTTTLTAPPITQDSTSHAYVPQSASEFSAVLALAESLSPGISSRVAVPTSLYLPDGYAGGGANILDKIGTFDMVPSGLNATFQQPVSGWSTRSIHWINGATFALKNTSVPNCSTSSFTYLVYCQFSAPTSTRGIISLGTAGGGIQIEVNTTPKLIGVVGANFVTGTAVPTGAVRCLTLTNNKTGGTARIYTDQEKQAITPGTPSGATAEVGGSSANGLAAPPMDVLFIARWDGAAGEISDADMKAIIQTLGNGLWSPP